MIDFNCATFNANGLNIPSKRGQTLQIFKKQNTDVLFIQETHFKKNFTPTSKHSFYKQWFNACTPSQRRKGVAILIGKNLPFVKSEVLTDPEGRYIFLKGKVGDRVFTFANIYAPNDKHIAFFRFVFKRLEPFMEGTLILGGDFNIALEPGIDTSRGRSKASYKKLKYIRNLFHEFQLIDIWRASHPTEREFSCFSNIHNSYSRIDYLMTTQSHLGNVTHSEYGSRILSDHAPLHVRFQFCTSRGKPYSWVLNESLLAKEENLNHIKTHLENYFKENILNNNCDPLVWEAHKSVIRGILIQIGSKEKRLQNKEIEETLGKIQKLERLHKASLCKKVEVELSQLRLKVKEILDIKFQRYLYMASFRHYLYANKCGKDLAKIARKELISKNISNIKTIDNKQVFCTREIANTFKEYYNRLYNLHPGKQSKDTQALDINNYLDSVTTPTLSREQIESLSAPFSVKEIVDAINSSPNGKSPGPDGFSGSYYKKFKDILAPHLADYFNKISPEVPFRTESLSAYITVIPKEGKDSSQCMNYRPISLLNNDLKLFAKILASRLRVFLGSLIDGDQTGFIPKREAKDNTIKVLHWIQHARIKRNPLLLVASDAEKAFDRLNWQYLRAVLEKFNFPTPFINKIMALYTTPSARIKVNGELSEPLNIRNGTRQGCPLSPLLFVLSLEPFLIKIRENSQIKGLRSKYREHKIAAYADDTLFVLTDPLNSLPNLIAEFDAFNKVSDFKINLNKSELFNVSLDRDTWEKTKLLSDIKPTNGCFKYLGINMCLSTLDLYKFNYDPLLKNIQKQLKEWEPLFLSWFGKISLIKMCILPKFLYMFACLPIEIPSEFFQKVKRELSKFVWQNKQNRIAYRTMTRSKDKGGLGLPDIEKYYKASILSRVMEWGVNPPQKLWVDIEKDCLMVNPLSLLWKSQTHYNKLRNVKNSLTKFSIQKWHSCNRESRFITPMGLDTPLINFIPQKWGFWQNLLKLNPAQAISPVGLLFNRDKFISRDDLEILFNNTLIPETQFRLLEKKLIGYKLTTGTAEPSNWVSRHLHSGTPLDHLLSKWYRLINDPIDQPNFIDKWAKELNKPFNDTQIQGLINNAFSNLKSYSYQEMQFKLVSRWYKTPVLMNRINPQIPKSCWRCGDGIGDYVHIWFKCPRISNFWKEINNIINDVFNTNVTLSSNMVIFNLYDVKQSVVKSELCTYFLSVAKKLIPRNWLQINPPTIREWFAELQKVQSFEKRRWRVLLNPAKFDHIWNKWSRFLTHTKELQLTQM